MIEGLCLLHTPDHDAARRYRIKTNTKDGLGCLGIVGLVILTAVYGLPALGQWLEGQRETRCRPTVDSYEEARMVADGIHIPLILGSDHAPGDENATEDAIKAAYAEKWSANASAADIALSHQDCFNEVLLRRARRARDSPAAVWFVSMPTTTSCRDGWGSPSIGQRGACSHHGGVAWGSPSATLHFEPTRVLYERNELPIRLASAE
ncbi:hypothetical protein [Streptomyces sp. NPDC003327]